MRLPSTSPYPYDKYPNIPWQELRPIRRGKKPHDIPVMLRRIRKAVAPYPKAAMFELAERGFGSPFQQLIGCILSIRTRDEVSLPTALRLLERASSAETMAGLSQ